MKSALLKFANNPVWCMALLLVLPIALRLALMPFHPAPIPAGGDDFSYLLLGDTVAHGRLANPTHPMHRFFETDFTLQEPTYSSIYPVGQGIALAVGQMIFGHPWAGVLLTQGLLCALCYWALCGWTTREWALAGELIAVMQFGPLSQWTNSYFGGGVSAIAGCLVFGSLPRLYWNGTWKQDNQKRNAILLGGGFGLQILTRPFEAALILFCVMLYFAPALRRFSVTKGVNKLAMLASIPCLVALGITVLQNQAVTGHWLKLPYLESRDQYGVPTTFTFQSNPIPHRTLTREQQLGYRAQAIIHDDGPDTPAHFVRRLRERFVHYRFFVPGVLYPAVLAFFWVLVRRGSGFAEIGWPHAWALLTVVLIGLGTNFYPYFYPHYIAALCCVFVVMCVTGLQILRRIPFAIPILGVLCAAQFVFWYGLHFSANENWITRFSRYQSPYFIPWGDPEGRMEVQRKLMASPGQQLVFVRYSPQHLFREWVHNSADIDAARIVWARDLGAAENADLETYYPDRSAWLLEPDKDPPRLRPYRMALEPDPLTFVPSTKSSEKSNSGVANAPSPNPAGGARSAPDPAETVPELPDSGWLIKKKKK
jgi:hypothetical protein